MHAQKLWKDNRLPRTREELAQLETAPKTRMQLLLDGIVCILPLLMGGLVIAEYVLIPNMQGNEITAAYLYFIGGLMVLYGTALIFSLYYQHVFAVVRYKAPFWSFIFILLALYDYLTLKTGSLMLPYFPWVDQILVAAMEDASYLWESAYNSIFLLFTGFAWGATIGLITGIACGYNKKINYWIAPFMKLLGAIPSITWLPVVLVLAGTLFQGSVFIIALGVWFAMATASFTGISNIDRSYFEAAKILGASDMQRVFRIAIPFALPSIFQGLTQGMSSACTALLVAEMIGVESGLGWYITWQKSWAQFGKMYAAIILICLIFILVTFTLGLIKNYVLRWQQGFVRE